MHLKVNIVCRHNLFLPWQEFSRILHSRPTGRKSTESQLGREGAVDLAGRDFVKILKSLCSVSPEGESMNVGCPPSTCDWAQGTDVEVERHQLSTHHSEKHSAPVFVLTVFPLLFNSQYQGSQYRMENVKKCYL